MKRPRPSPASSRSPSRAARWAPTTSVRRRPPCETIGAPPRPRRKPLSRTSRGGTSQRTTPSSSASSRKRWRRTRISRSRRRVSRSSARSRGTTITSRRSPRAPRRTAQRTDLREPASAALVGGQTINVFELSAAFTWEIDLWGRLRRTNESTLARFLATEEARRGVYLGLVSDVAAAYYQLRSLDLQLEIARRTVGSRKESFDLVEKRLRGGIGNKLESSQAASALAQTEVAIPQLEQAIFEQENLISLLLGRPPGPIARGKADRRVACRRDPGGPAVRTPREAARRPRGRGEPPRGERRRRRRRGEPLPAALSHRERGIRRAPTSRTS